MVSQELNIGHRLKTLAELNLADFNSQTTDITKWLQSYNSNLSLLAVVLESVQCTVTLTGLLVEQQFTIVGLYSWAVVIVGAVRRTSPLAYLYSLATIGISTAIL